MKKEYSKTQAKELIQKYLFDARKEFAGSKRKADLLVHKARNLSMSYNLPIPRQLKRSFCKHCYTFLMPGKNCRIRTREGKVIYYCMECKNHMRFVMKKR